MMVSNINTESLCWLATSELNLMNQLKYETYDDKQLQY